MIHPAKKPQPNGFDLSLFAPSLDGEAGESLGSFLQRFEGTVIEPKKGTYFTMTCLFAPGETARKIMDAAGNNFIAGKWHDTRPEAALLDQLSAHRETIENLMEAAHNLLAIARSEDCACGGEGCTETADAWKALELAGRDAHALINPNG